MDTLEISLRTEQGIYTETYNPPQNFLGHFTVSVKSTFVLSCCNKFPLHQTKAPQPPPPTHVPSNVVQLKVFRRNQQATLMRGGGCGGGKGSLK